MVLDDSDYRIPDEWGLKEAYNDEESVVHHGDTLYIAGTHTLRDVLDECLGLLPLAGLKVLGQQKKRNYKKKRKQTNKNYFSGFFFPPPA